MNEFDTPVPSYIKSPFTRPSSDTATALDWNHYLFTYRSSIWKTDCCCRVSWIHSSFLYSFFLHASFIIIYTIEAMIPYKCSAEVETTTNLGSSLAVNSIKRVEQKVLCLAVLERLVATDHSLARSHYWLTWGLLAAEFPPWPSPPLLSQPDPSWLPRWVHVDASLSADAGSTWISDQQESPPQAIQQNLPPSSWITRARHCSRLS